MGGITTILFFNYLKQFDASVASNEKMVEVVVASKQLKKNERISADKVAVTKIPESARHPLAITKIKEVDGLIVNADIEAGEILLPHRVQQEEDEKLLVSRKVKEGYRAVSIGVNFVQSVSNLIEPEDYVDVVFSEAVKRDGGTSVVTQLILENVRVLAVGRKLIESTTGETYVEYSAATLEVNTKDAVRLINASERGNLHLTLHSRIMDKLEE